MEYVHVKDKATGHEYVVPESRFNSDAHTKTGKPARDAHGDLVPTKFTTTVEKAAAKKTSAKTAAKSGQKAETEKE